MKVMNDRCDVCRSWGPCYWSSAPMLRLCVGCFEARFDRPPEGLL